MQLFLPKHILTWIDSNRGTLSRQAFIVHCLNQIIGVSKG